MARFASLDWISKWNYFKNIPTHWTCKTIFYKGWILFSNSRLPENFSSPIDSCWQITSNDLGDKDIVQILTFQPVILPKGGKTRGNNLFHVNTSSVQLYISPTFIALGLNTSRLGSRESAPRNFDNFIILPFNKLSLSVKYLIAVYFTNIFNAFNAHGAAKWQQILETSWASGNGWIGQGSKFICC